MKFTWTMVAAIAALAWLLGRGSQNAPSSTASPQLSPTQPAATPLTISTFDVVKLAAGAIL